ncbi:uncharacterized protein BJ212DRAFT_1546354 [Suillus subaureus]|uniref:Protein kinase domain-containing protein n=1 Tax=Suillus subaureus TaxID=48587 RepID=A0A9P7EHZ3_9AGAM|nr:uncharacterized protein BJ212DRAFT_1546354 [Suillus subaureus]KAG1821632.1 hypothetical protein BJ212DRAFT_1546354 [Suillus subaureus]
MTTTPVDSQAISKPTNQSSLDDLTEFITKTINYPVASGSFGLVYKCNYKCEKQSLQVAVKRFLRIDLENKEALRREIGVWKRLRHESIVPLLGYTRLGDYPSEPVSLVSLWMSKGTLHQYLDGKIREDKYLLLCNVANGLHYLHSESVVHGDLTSMNVLVDEKGQACLADFGLSSMVKIGPKFEYLRPREKQPGALIWSAPELSSFDVDVDENENEDEDVDADVTTSLNHKEVTERYIPSPSSDMYSYGCIMFQVLSGKVPEVTPWCVMKGKTRERPQAVQDEDWIFILQCWLSLPSLRPVASQALKFAGTRARSFMSTGFPETSNRASTYTAHLDDANVYNLSSLVPSHTQPAFSDPEACWKSVHKLAKALLDLFKKTTRGDQRLLNDAIQLYHVALATLPPTPIASSLHKVIAATAQIGTRRRDDENSDAIERLRFRMESVDVNDPFHFTGSSYLSLVDIAKHMTDQGPDSISSAKIWYRKSFNDTISGVLCRLQIALACARIAEKVVGEDEFRLEAYEMSLQLLQSHISATPTLTWAVEHLSTSLAVDAAATALGIKQVNKAVELLEWGRELLWTYIARSRTGTGGEKEKGTGKEKEKEKDQEEDSKKISKVEQLNLLVSGVLDTLQETSSLKSAVVPNAKVHEIREAEGTPRSHPPISDLLKATQDGPVVMLIASRRSCDAIIVSNAYPKPLHVQLEITFSSLAELSTTFQACTSSVPEDPDSVEDDLKEILCRLWHDVVVPVIAQLKEKIPPGRNSRIWWCPTSVFSTLPVHAAGDYTVEGEQLPQQYVSSYTSSISSLVRARNCADHPVPSSKFAAIYQAKPLENDEGKEVEYPAIEFAEMEPEMVKRNLPPSFFFTRFPDATKEDAIEAFKDHGWFHLVAYATRNAYQPFNSSFLMRDGLLSLPDIPLACSEPKEFAFLSARPVGPQFRWMQNETTQFAAGLQFSGFKSVIGTIGNLDDSKAYEIIDKFYKAIFCTETLDCARAARALHGALEEMAKGDLSFRQRIAFAHFGL